MKAETAKQLTKVGKLHEPKERDTLTQLEALIRSQAEDARALFDKRIERAAHAGESVAALILHSPVFFDNNMGRFYNECAGEVLEHIESSLAADGYTLGDISQSYEPVTTPAETALHQLVGYISVRW